MDIIGYGACRVHMALFVVSLTSETNGSFTNKASAHPAFHSKDGDHAESQGASHVFCRGDYDLPLNMPPDHFLSVQQRDYPARTGHLTKEKDYPHVVPRLEGHHGNM